MMYITYGYFVAMMFIIYSVSAQNEEQGDLRLAGGGLLPPNAGQLQMFYNGQWGAVSDSGKVPADEDGGDRFQLSDRAANVACYQMFGVRTAYTIDEDLDSFWMQLEVPVLYLKFDCDGDEDRLIDCPFDSASEALSSFNVELDDAVWMSCNVQETFVFDQPEYIFTNYTTNPQVMVHRYHLQRDDPVSAVDVRLDRVSLADSKPTTKRINFAATHSQNSATVDIPLPAEDDPDNPTVYEVTLTESTNGVALLGEPSMVYIFHNINMAVPDDVVFTFQKPAYSVSESVRETKVTIIKAANNLNVPSSVSVSTVDTGDATENLDYTPVASRLVMFNAGDSTAETSIEILSDTFPEGKEAFILQLDNPSTGTLGSNPTTTITINDDDAKFFWAQESHYTNEGSTDLVLTMMRSGYLGDEASVGVSTQDGSAIAGADYQAMNNLQVTFPADEPKAYVVVPLVNDNDHEPSEQFSLVIESSNPSEIGTPARAYVVIDDDDNELCNPPCQNGGECSSSDVCLCPPNYTGLQCQSELCNPPCQNGGECSSSDVCVCPPNYTGLQCQSALCNPPCTNGGQCSSPGLCLCPPNYTGLQCQSVSSETGRVVVGQFSVVTIDGAPAVFNPALNVHGSSEQMELNARLLPMLRSVFNIPDIESVTITNYLPGSIIVKYNAVVMSGSEIDADAIDELSASFLQLAATSGIIVDASPTTTFTQELCPGGYCANGGTCTADTINLRSTCRCTSNYKGNQCQDSNTDGLSAGAVAGIGVAAMLSIIVTLTLVFLYVRHRGNKQSPTRNELSFPTLNSLDLAPYPYTYPRTFALGQDQSMY